MRTHGAICIRMQILHICKICTRMQIAPCVQTFSVANQFFFRQTEKTKFYEGVAELNCNRKYTLASPEREEEIREEPRIVVLIILLTLHPYFCQLKIKLVNCTPQLVLNFCLSLSESCFVLQFNS